MTTLARFLLLVHLVLLAAVIGAALTFFGLLFAAKLAGAEDVNGGLAMGAAALAPYGAALGAVLGGWLVWRWQRGLAPRVLKIAGYGLTALSVCLVAGYFVAEELSDGNPYDPAHEPTVHLEWRLPEQVDHASVKSIFRHSMRSSYMDWILTTQWDEPYVRDEGGATILRFRGNIRWRVTGRTFQVWRAPYHDDRMTVVLDLAADPEPSEQYGVWQDATGYPGNAFRTRVNHE